MSKNPGILLAQESGNILGTVAYGLRLTASVYERVHR